MTHQRAHSVGELCVCMRGSEREREWGGRGRMDSCFKRVVYYVNEVTTTYWWPANQTLHHWKWAHQVWGSLLKEVGHQNEF